MFGNEYRTDAGSDVAAGRLLHAIRAGLPCHREFNGHSGEHLPQSFSAFVKVKQERSKTARLRRAIALVINKDLT